LSILVSHSAHPSYKIMATTPGENFAAITIDGITNLLEDLSKYSRQLMTSLVTAQQEPYRLRVLAGITQTAIAAYCQALKQEIVATSGSSVG
jgi:hypothetical protein